MLLHILPMYWERKWAWRMELNRFRRWASTKEKRIWLRRHSKFTEYGQSAAVKLQKYTKKQKKQASSDGMLPWLPPLTPPSNILLAPTARREQESASTRWIMQSCQRRALSESLQTQTQASLATSPLFPAMAHVTMAVQATLTDKWTYFGSHTAELY